MNQETKKQLKALKAALAKTEAALDKCRTSVMQDGWQTSRHAKKSRKWDFYGRGKMMLLQRIDDLEKEVDNNLVD